MRHAVAALVLLSIPAFYIWFFFFLKAHGEWGALLIIYVLPGLFLLFGLIGAIFQWALETISGD